MELKLGGHLDEAAWQTKRRTLCRCPDPENASSTVIPQAYSTNLATHSVANLDLFVRLHMVVHIVKAKIARISCCKLNKLYCTLVLDPSRLSVSDYAQIIKQCTAAKDLASGRGVHAQIVEQGLAGDRFLMNLLVGMYSSCGCISHARQIFEMIKDKNEYSWSMMLSANARNGYPGDTVRLYRRMQLEGGRPDKCHFSMALQACSSMRDLAVGRRVHKEATIAGCIDDLGVAADLLTMYKVCGRLDEARKAFDSMHKRDLVLWTSMIAAYAQNGHGADAINMFRLMDLDGMKPDRVTFVSLVDACTGCLQRGRQVHERVVALGLERDLVIATGLVHMYAQCGQVVEARLVFDKMTHRNVVSWNAMLAAYARLSHCKETLDLFRRMDQEGTFPDRVTFPSVLDVCSEPSSFLHGQALHDRIIAMGLDRDLVIQSALLNMYAKSGKLERARTVFDSMLMRNLVSWNTMIAAYAQNGHAHETLGAFLTMSLEGLWPDDITFLSVVSACSHAGMMESGLEFFSLFSNVYGVSANLEHFGCLIDLLGRAGKLQEAEELIHCMPFYPDNKIWTAFVSACASHRKKPLKLSFDSYSEKSGLFVLLSNFSMDSCMCSMRSLLGTRPWLSHVRTARAPYLTSSDALCLYVPCKSGKTLVGGHSFFRMHF